MKLKQREMNRKALEMAVSLVRDSDFEQLFADDAYAAETPGEEDQNEEVMQKAQAYAAARIERLIAP